MESEYIPEDPTEDEIRRSVYGKSLPEMHIGDYDRSITRPTVSFARKCVIWSRDRKIYETASRNRLAEFNSKPYFRFEYPEIPRHWPGTWSVITDSELKGVVGRLSRPSTALPDTTSLSRTSRARPSTTSSTSTPWELPSTAPPVPAHKWIRERYNPQRPPSRPLTLPTVIQFLQIKYSCTDRSEEFFRR